MNMADPYEAMEFPEPETEPETKGKKPKKPKKERTPKKERKPIEAKVKKSKKEKKKRGKLLALLIPLIVGVAAIGTFIFLSIQFDVFGTRTIFINWACSLDPEYGDFADRISDLEYQLDDIETREADIEYQWELLAEEREELANWEQEIYAEVGGHTPLWRSPMTDGDLADMKNLAKIYGAMAAADAADIMAQLYSADEMAAILYYLTAKKAASVLTAMDHDLSASITEILMSK
jgi:flagellar motility protein MotE (MotC chaperone)